MPDHPVESCLRGRAMSVNISQVFCVIFHRTPPLPCLHSDQEATPDGVRALITT
jgi:hypothetical protein